MVTVRNNDGIDRIPDHDLIPPHDWEAPYTEIQDSTKNPEWFFSEDRKLGDGSPIRFKNGYSWEMDESGNHRIVDNLGRGGDWASYDRMAMSPDGRYTAGTQYWIGYVPCETLIELRTVERS